MFKLVGTLPCDIYRSALLWMCSTDDVDEELLLEDYLLFLSEANAIYSETVYKLEQGRKQREEG